MALVSTNNTQMVEDSNPPISTIPTHFFISFIPHANFFRAGWCFQHLPIYTDLKNMHKGLNEPGNFVKIDSISTFPCFTEAWTEITAIAIAKSLLFRLRKLACCKQPLMKLLSIRMANHPLHLLPYTQPIIITSIS